MKRPALTCPHPSNAFVSRISSHSRYDIVGAFANFFPATDFPDYDAFLNALGSCLKREQRTIVTIFHRVCRGSSSEDDVSSFVLKVYKYPFWPRIRTGFQISKAEREFHNLRYLNRLGIGAAQAVAYGVDRDCLGLVRSCFVITRFVDNSMNLSQWSDELRLNKNVEIKRLEQIFTELGQTFRRLHQARFFLFSPKSKNILVRQGSNRADELLLIDVPYARTLKWPVLASWARARDVGVLFANLTESLSEIAIELFYRAYLPDPLGLPANTVRRHVLRQMRVKQNRTLLSRSVNKIKRRLMGKINQLIGFLILAEIAYG
ncbi:MAG TPA: lipopolysaccharide kinase InaA family protein [Candidatus Binatia bacterium]|nr:lipopolysaccharide kinase InaA family protein [Candidatus Binatia bacterium]